MLGSGHVLSMLPTVLRPWRMATLPHYLTMLDPARMQLADIEDEQAADGAVQCAPQHVLKVKGMHACKMQDGC